MDSELEELKRNLRSKSFALDDVIPLTRRAALAIEELQAEILVLHEEVQRCRASEARLKTLTETIGRLIAEKSVIDTVCISTAICSLDPLVANGS